jgi:deoxyribonuclease-4
MQEAKIFLGPAGIGIGCKGSSTVDGIKYAHDVGLNAMEVEFVRGVKMGNDLAKECGRVAKELDVDLSVHAPYFVNLSSVEKVKIAASQKRILDAVERGHHMGACVVAFHPGYYGKMKKEEAYITVKESLKELVGEMRRKGIDDVKLGLETTGKQGAFGTLDEVVRLCKEIKQCTPVVDFAHIYARQGGKIDYEKVLDAVKPLCLKHMHSHFSNIEFTSKGERRHLPLDSSPAFEPLAKELLKRKINIAIICESPMLEKDSLKMKAVFEKLGYRF